MPQTIDTSTRAYTLYEATKYALGNQPALRQSIIDEKIAHVNKNIALSTWLPQVNGAANYQHYFQLPTVFTSINGVPTPVNSGVYNLSLPQVNATQNLFSSDALLANKTARLGIELARENTTNVQINVVTNVSKAYYDVLLSVEQINVYKEDTARLKKNREDAYNRYVSGVTDKVDYKQASIQLNNSLAQLKAATEALKAKYAYLKQLMGYPAEKGIAVSFDTTEMLRSIYADTLEQLRIEKRIEYQQLMTARRLQHETTAYYKLSFLPNVYGFYSYVAEFESNNNSDLYAHMYPYSYIGVQLNVPIFTGLKRLENVKKAKLQEERMDWDESALRLSIYAEYQQALATYKSNLFAMNEQYDNVQMAREVYDIVKLQYREGIKAYLDVIVAESDLQTSEINYQNALFQVLQSKVNLEKAMGDVVIDY